MTEPQPDAHNPADEDTEDDPAHAIKKVAESATGDTETLDSMVRRAFGLEES